MKIQKTILLAMVVALERELDMPAAYGPLTSRLLARALSEGRGNRDFTTLYTMVEQLMEAELAGRSATP